MHNASGNRFIPVSQWSKYHPWPSLSGLRHLIFHRKRFHFEGCIRRAGRRVLISEKDFLIWLDQQSGKQATK